MAFFMVGLSEPVATRIAVCPTMAAAETLIETLPNYLDGRYYIDECHTTVRLDD